MGWTVLFFGQNFCVSYCQNFRIVFYWRFSYKTIWFKPYCILVKFFLKDNMDWTVLSFSENFLKRQYGLNRIVFWSKLFSKDNMGWTIFSFGENSLKRQYGLNRIVFWSKFLCFVLSKFSYCLLLEIFLKDNMGWTILSFG